MSVTLQIAPAQWGRLKDIDDVEPINDGDLECLADLRDVLKKHGKCERFGVALLHKHFEMEEGELLVEFTDKEARELTIKPVKSEAVGNTVETIWMLLDGENRAMLGCRQSCSKDGGWHSPYHTWT
jgi:hypothetical protein